MAIEPVNERPIFPQLIRLDPLGVGNWSVSMIRQLTTVFMQYGYRLNHSLLDEQLAANGGSIPEVDRTNTWVPVQVFQAAPTATGHPLRWDELAANGGSIPEVDRANAFVAGQTQGGNPILDQGTSGVVIQHAFTSSGAVIASTTTIPYDDTIPQITEGHRAFFIDFTPKRSDSRIRISTNLHMRSDNVSVLAAVAAIFESGVNDALGATVEFVNQTAPVHTFGLSVDIASTGTSQRTFSVRFGPHNTGTMYLNGNETGTRVFGGVSASTMEIVEYMP